MIKQCCRCLGLSVSHLSVYLHRHQFVENNLILKMGPVDKRKVCVWSLVNLIFCPMRCCFTLFCVKKLVLKLVSLQGNFAWQTAGVMCCNLGLKSRSCFPHFSMFEINWLGLCLPWAKVDSAYIKSFCSDTGNTGSKEEFLLSELFLAGELPLLAKSWGVWHSFAGIVRSTETAASHGRTTPVLCGSCQQGPERRDPLVSGAASWGQELQNLLCSHSTWPLSSDVCPAFFPWHAYWMCRQFTDFLNLFVVKIVILQITIILTSILCFFAA